jgi:endonuclease/exonuclease/phosphatase (EEP) superfamily protein YafD
MDHDARGIAAPSSRHDCPLRPFAAVFFALLCLAGLCLPWLARLSPSSPNTLTWLLDLAAHWQILYAPLWLALCLVCAAHARRWLLLAPLALLPFWSASESLPDNDGGVPALIVAAANVNVGNRDPAPLVAWLRAQPADVVAISELTPRYADALAHGLGDDYAYRLFSQEDSPFGIGLISRRPLREPRIHRSRDGIPFLSAIIDTAHGPVRIVAIHPMPPLDPHWHDERDALLRQLAKGAADSPTVVAGDLNATPWSTALIGAGRHSLLRATGLAPTWPNSGHGVSGIPIDHVLASRHWRRGASSRGPGIGSDHFPVRAELYWTDVRDRHD